MFHIVFVCTGNTCRSPMAEVLFKNILNQQAMNEVNVSSAGLMAGQGPASFQAQKVMQRRGLNLSDHISKMLNQDLVQKADLILTMTEGHKKIILAQFPDAISKTYTLGEWSEIGNDIDDPYGGDEAYYDACANQLSQYLVKISEKLANKAGKKENS